MKKTKYNLRVVTDLDMLAHYHKEFQEVGPVSVLVYDIGEGVYDIYAQIYITEKITVALYDDSQEFAFKSEGKDLFKVSWNPKTESLLRNLKGKSAMDALVIMAAHIVRD
ncbi:hypothetical protein ACTL32_18405 [Planococcus sp. FY231025]|uniref:hypothetical protein n=1 Tax=Planococcus sp. FY231025 TaxID=3455699 RepID=UPI003F924918